VIHQSGPEILLVGDLDDLPDVPARPRRQVDGRHLAAAVMGEHDPAL
jgi:hypothetical protein